MKIEFHLDGPNTTTWFRGALADYHAAREADTAYYDEKWGRDRDFATGSAGAGAPVPVEAPVEAEKPKASRTRKKAEDPAPEQAQITTSPEDRKPVEEIEVAEAVEETAPEVDLFEEAPAQKVYTRDDVKAAMQVYVAKHGMDQLAVNAGELLGAPKLSAIPEDPAAFATAVERLEAATNG